MPNKHRFPPQKCDPNPNFRTNSIAGCKYDPKPPPFKPQTRTITELALKPTTVIPQPTTVTPQTTTVTPRPDKKPDKKPDTLTSQTNASLNIIGLGHFVSNKQNNNEDDDNNDDEPLWSKVIKEKVKATKKMDMDAYVEYKELTSVEVEAAKMTKASYINLREGPYASQAYANEHLKNWKLDTTLSDEHTSVFVSKEGKVVIAYRGTQAGRDWATNAKLALGLEESSTQMQEVEKTFQKIVQKYGKGSIEFFTGHSKGGGQAIAMGNKHNIPTITQDPALTPKMIKDAKSHHHHHVNRTPTDWVSGLTPVAKNLKSDSFTQILIKPTKGTGILSSHDVNLIAAYDYVPKSGQGDTNYNPKAKNKAYIAKLLKSGMTFDDIRDSVGLQSANLFDDYNEVVANPNEDFMKSAGYEPNTGSASKPVSSSLTDHLTTTVETATSHVATNANKFFNRSTGANVVASVAAATALQHFGADDTTAAVVGGGIGNVAGEMAGRGVGTNTVIGGRAITIRNAAGSGMIGGIAGNVAQQEAYHVLTNAGVDHASATLISSTAGGATQGAAEYQANVAIAYAERQYGRGVISAAVRNAIAGGIERVGLTETLGVIAGEVGGGAMRGRWGGWYGTLIGAGIGLVGGIVSVATAEQEHEVYALVPAAFEQYQYQIGGDYRILRIMSEFNESNDFSDEHIRQVKAQIQEVVSNIQNRTGQNLPYDVDFMQVPEHVLPQGSVMLPAEHYTDVFDYYDARDAAAVTEPDNFSEAMERGIEPDILTASPAPYIYTERYTGDDAMLNANQNKSDVLAAQAAREQAAREQAATAQVWHDIPPPNTANEHTPTEPDTDNFSEAMERGIIP